MKKIITMIGLYCFSLAGFANEDMFCCIQSALDNNNGVSHSGKSEFCVSNNSEELTEIQPDIFAIKKHGYTFKIDLTTARLKSIAITKPNGKVQTGPERELLKGVWDLYIGTFGEPQYQYASETAGGFRLDCSKKRRI